MRIVTGSPIFRFGNRAPFQRQRSLRRFVSAVREPRLLEIPLPARANSAAWALGRYCSVRRASNTLARVLNDTLPRLLVTLDTVAIDTSANLATSRMVHGRRSSCLAELIIILHAKRVIRSRMPQRPEPYGEFALQPSSSLASIFETYFTQCLMTLCGVAAKRQCVSSTVRFAHFCQRFESASILM